MLSAAAAFTAYPGASFRGSVPPVANPTDTKVSLNYSLPSTTSSTMKVMGGFAGGLAAAAGVAYATSRNSQTLRSRTVRGDGMTPSAWAPPKMSEGMSLSSFDPPFASMSVGVLAPVDYWDPCGLMKDGSGNWKDEATFKTYRTAELKHGRVAMLATTGMLTATLWKFPGYESVDNGFAAFNEAQGGAGFGLIVILAAWCEFVYPDGNFPDPLGFGSFKGWGYNDDMRNKELNHGRMAMFAIFTMFIYEFGTGETPSILLQTTFGARGPNPISGPVCAMIATVLLLLPTTPYGAAKQLKVNSDDTPTDAVVAAVGWLSEASGEEWKGDIPAVRALEAKTKALP